MQTTLKVFLFSILALSACSGPPARPAPGPTPDATRRASLGFELNRALGRGINLGNALEAPVEGEWGMTLEKEYFEVIRQGGFQSVRVPIRWSAHAMQGEPYTVEREFFERVDWVIDQALENDLRVIINMHHYDELFQDPAGHSARFVAIWKQIAERYQGRPESLYFEFLNEPNSSLGASAWNRLFAETLQVVRQSNPYRGVVVGPANWNAVGELANLSLPEDDRSLIVTVHYYQPFQFTHQGAEWVSGSDPWLGTTWKGTSNEAGSIRFDLDRAETWGREHDRPIFLGEFGAYGKADMESRALWTAFMAREAEKRGFRWAYWEFGAGFGAYDREKEAWIRPIYQALIPQD